MPTGGFSEEEVQIHWEKLDVKTACKKKLYGKQWEWGRTTMLYLEGASKIGHTFLCD